MFKTKTTLIFSLTNSTKKLNINSVVTFRSQAVENFKSGKMPLLVATDVAARGLDIPDVDYVINFSFPLTIEDYVHRLDKIYLCI